MNTPAIRALIKNDLRLYSTDRRALVVGILVPIFIAAFFGYVFGGNGDRQDMGKIPVAWVDEDQSGVSRAIGADFAAESLVSVQTLSRAEAQEGVRKGKVQVAAIIPKGFGYSATRALFSGQQKPRVELLLDPTQAMSGSIVEGLLAQHGMQEISKEAFSGPSGEAALSEYIDSIDRAAPGDVPQQAELRAVMESLRALNSRRAAASDGALNGRQGLSIPYEVATQKITSGRDVAYNGYAHSFAGMTIQFILLAGIDAGIVLLLLRDRGIWQRFRSAPLSKSEFMIARTLTTTLISAFQFAVIYTAAVVIFGVRINGSVVGFIAVAAAVCLMNATFGLMLAAVGSNPGATRGIASMVTLLLVMLGGAWVPSFVFPQWLQQASLAAPTRWAIDALDAVTWRGLDFHSVISSLAVLIATSLVCLMLAIWGFRWEE